MSKVHEKLENEKIPYNYGPSSRSVESESIAIKIFEAGIRVIINPFDNVHFNQILSLLNYKDKSGNRSEQKNYLEMLSSISDSTIDEEYVKYFKPIQQAWKVLIEDEENFSKALKILSESLVSAEMYNLDDNVENEQYLIQKDIDMWKEQWKKYCSQSVAGQRSLSHFRNQVSLGRTQTHNNSGISLLTVHMSKGLEYEVVFLIGLNEGTFPDYRARSTKEYNEELNNMFVALTRAKRICYLSYPQYKLMPWGDMKYQNPSRFIKMIGLD
ncbi:3'-5' exonuclease [Bacillus coahuilensis]|uniref:3'-5' exonuclease n=1 Tax=Bacillus coahuilensis TaxID=408580 RepID=UPI0001850E5A|nr:3'-5' exonuclease [Bacillus coahuilensis]